MKAHLPWKGRRDLPTYLPSREPASDTNHRHNTSLAVPVRSTVRDTKRTSLPLSPLRVALYSHDAMGLGHMRRNLLIAQTLASSALRADVLVIAGASEATAFGLPAGVDCLTLPALRKDSQGSYHSRNLRLDLKQLLELRGRTICTALEAFQPDIFIVDKLSRGVLGELDPSLARLKEMGQTSCVLGLRDVLDEPEAVRRDWRKEASEEAIRNYYREIWVYGD